MKKIYEILNKKRQVGDVGIEIEAEGDRLPFNFGSAFWKYEDDPSLRGYYPESRCEYVLQSPIQINFVKHALKELFGAGEQKGTQWKFSFRCSTHVHLNVLDLTEEELYTLLYTYLLLEEPLVRFCGRERIHNRFALRTQDAEYTLEYFNELFQKGIGFLKPEHENALRYAGVNLYALRKYGSLEFRSMRGTSDIGAITTWVEAIYALKKFSIGKTVEEVSQLFVNQGGEEFIKTVLGAVHKSFKYQKLDYDTKFGYSLSLPLLYTKRFYTKEKALNLKDANPAELIDLMFEAQHQDRVVVPRVRRAQINLQGV